mgnify:CR=1 FL=1
MARAPFKLKSGNKSSFKMMGSSPAKQTKIHKIAPEINTSEIWNKANAEYLEKGDESGKIKKEAQAKVDKAVSYNKSRANYLKHVASIAPTPSQSAKSKGTLIDPNNPDVKHDDIIVEPIYGKVNISKPSNRAKRKKEMPSLYERAKRFVRGGWRD